MIPAIRSRVWFCAVVLTVFGLLPATAVLAAESEQPAKAQVTVKVIHNTDTLHQMRTSPMGAHLKAVAEELRLLTEARLAGTAAPTLTTNALEVEAMPSGMTRGRLGADQLHTAMIRFDAAGAPVAACVEGTHTSQNVATVNNAPKLEEQ